MTSLFLISSYFFCVVSNLYATYAIDQNVCGSHRFLISDGVVLTQVDVKVFAHQGGCTEPIRWILFSLLSEGASQLIWETWQKLLFSISFFFPLIIQNM